MNIAARRRATALPRIGSPSSPTSARRTALSLSKRRRVGGFPRRPTRGAEKMNLWRALQRPAAVHFHVVARFADDRNWPGSPLERVIPSLSSSSFQILGSLMIRHTIDAAARKSKITAGC
jgi:hypothetical protein